MADLDTTLAAIDAVAVQECGGCGNPLPDNGPSRYYCSEACQGRWSRGRADVPTLAEELAAERDTWSGPMSLAGVEYPGADQFPEVRVFDVPRRPERYGVQWPEVFDAEHAEHAHVRWPTAEMVVHELELTVAWSRGRLTFEVQARVRRLAANGASAICTIPVACEACPSVTAEGLAAAVASSLQRRRPDAQIDPDLLSSVVMDALIRIARART